VIEGRLVNLRAPDMADLQRNHRWMNDREVTRFLGGAARYVMSLGAEEAWLRERCERMMSFDNVFFAVETKDGVHIGNTNFFNAGPEDRRAELGIMIGERDYWSKGLGTDAVLTIARFGFDDMNLHRIILHVFSYNPRAIACYRKCGFVEEVRMRQDMFHEGAYHDTIVMGLLRDDFRRLEEGA